MKKILLTTLVATGLASAAFAQGTVTWANVGGLVIAQTNSTVYFGGTSTGSGTVGYTLGNNTANNTALGYTGYYYELLVSTTATTAPTTIAGFSAWTDTTLSATNGAGSNGHIIQTAAQGTAANTQATATGWALGTSANVILVGWSANLGTSWTAVLAELKNWAADGIAGAYLGVSSVGTLTSGTANPGVIVFGSNAGQINNGSANPLQLDLLAVPEPGTMALAALGGASLLLFRRKK
jgi:hypothetical protein